MTETPNLDALLDAALAHVAFDGWSDETFAAGAEDAGLSLADARGLAPRGALDLAMAYHRRGDREMVTRMENVDLSGMRYSERVAAALKFRIDVMTDREAVRRATTLFALPMHAADGAKLVWETADHIWTALGDTSEDGNWYTKRATLSAVWGSVVLYWLGDDSPDYGKTSDFIDRRIENVMQIETLKGRMQQNPLTKPLMELQNTILGRMSAPKTPRDVPGV
jgi:ubiquinone biosynthesis protein COQ9